MTSTGARLPAIGAGVLAGMLAPAAASAASFEVNKANDGGDGTCNDGTCTLRDALLAANAQGGIDDITFASNVTGTVTLTNGDIPVTEGVTITGPGPGVLEFSGDADGSRTRNAGDSRILAIEMAGGNEGDPVQISGLGFTYGAADFAVLASDGGAIRSVDADLTLDDVVIDDSATATTDFGAFGGGLYFRTGDLEITNSIISDNESANGGGLAADYQVAGDTTVSITNSTLSGNDAEFGGGAVVETDLTITDSTFFGNSATPGPGPDPYGGGLLIFHTLAAGSPDVLIQGSTFNGNQGTSYGGAISVPVHRGEFTIERSTIHGNTANLGAGVYMRNVYDNPVTISDTTITGNTATTSGGGVYRYGANGPGTDELTIANSIVAGNAAPSGEDLGEGPAGEGAFIVGNSLIEDGGADATVTQSPAGSNIFGQDPGLGALQDNGGATLTRLPNAGSPVLDTGNSAFATDQRGLPRTSDADPNTLAAPRRQVAQASDADMGAVERQSGDVTIDSGPGARTSDQTPTFSFSSPDSAATFSCTIDGNAVGGASCTSPLTLGTLAEGSHTFAVTATSSDGVAGQPATSTFTVDTTGPSAQFDSRPGPTNEDTTPTFEFSSPDGDVAGFECSLDGAPFASCTSPATVGPLSLGDHTFAIRATDDVGNTGATVIAAFVVAGDTTVFDADVTAKKKQKQKGRQIKVKIKGGAGEAVSGVAKGRIRVRGGRRLSAVPAAKTFKLKKVRKSSNAGQQKTYRLKLKKKKDNKRVFKLLRKGRDLRANPSLKLTDAAGNSVTEKRVVRLKLKR